MQLLRRAILALMLLFPGLHHGHAESNTRNVRPPAGDPSDERQVEIRHETLEDILARQAGRRDPRLPRDADPFERLVEGLASPYDDDPRFEDLRRAPEPHEVVHRTFCGT